MERFKALHEAHSSEIFKDPQMANFIKLKIFQSDFYYCRTPILPDWLSIIATEHSNNHVEC